MLSSRPRAALGVMTGELTRSTFISGRVKQARSPQVRRWMVIASWVVGRAVGVSYGFRQVKVAEAQVVIVVGVPDPKVPVFGRLVNVATVLGGEEFTLVEVHGISLCLPALVGGQVLFAPKLLGKLFSSLPFHQHRTRLVADKAAFFGSFGEIKRLAGGKHRVVLAGLWAEQTIQLAEVGGVESRQMKLVAGVRVAGKKLLRFRFGDAIGSAWQPAVCRTDENDRAWLGVAALAVAAPGGLDDRVQRPQGTERNGEIHVHTGFDELSRDEAAGQAIAEAAADSVELFPPVCRTEARGKVKTAVMGAGAQQLEELPGVFGGVDNTERLDTGEQAESNLLPRD